MTIAFQSSVFALIAISILLVIGVPVALASPNGWSSSKKGSFSGVSLRIGLVLLVSIPNSLISWICSKISWVETLLPSPEDILVRKGISDKSQETE